MQYLIVKFFQFIAYLRDLRIIKFCEEIKTLRVTKHVR